jgi:predicted  nucleic acid-binding Zn-ribbon protein
LHFIQCGKRRATLDQKTLLYLQNRLSVLFSRVARDDIDWLSLGDLDLKIEVLGGEADKKRRQMKGKQDELKSAKTEVKREELQDDIEIYNEKLKELEYELGVATEARDQARSAGHSAAPDTASNDDRHHGGSGGTSSS